MKREIEDWDEFLAEDDDIEIVEVVGLAEDVPGSDPAPEPPRPDDGDAEGDIVMEFDASGMLHAAEAALGADPSVELEPFAPPTASTAASVPAADEPDAAVADLTDRLVRLQADFDNYRKRAERDRLDFQAEANGKLILDLLPLIDNFERALESDHGDDGQNFQQGVILIFRQFLAVLRGEGLSPIDAEGERFDPSIHEAVATDEPGYDHYRITEVVQRGYRLNGRLLRPALVKVQAERNEE